jgi:hypothetical protein
MKCHFCGEEMVTRKETCFCEGEGCSLCDRTGKVTIVQCINSNCEPPDHNLEPWDDEE